MNQPEFKIVVDATKPKRDWRRLAVRMALGTVLVLAWVAFAFGCWKLDRWLNWRFSYEQKVEERLRTLEERVRQLEQAR